jgi:hypothetical protein
MTLTQYRSRGNDIKHKRPLPSLQTDEVSAAIQKNILCHSIILPSFPHPNGK